MYGARMLRCLILLLTFLLSIGATGQTILPGRPAGLAIQAEDLAEAIRLNRQAVDLLKVGRFDEALPFARRAVALFESKYPDNVEYPNALNTLAAVYKEKGRYDEAERLLQQALGLCDELPQSDETSINRAIVLNSVGSICYEKGDLRCAEKAYLNALPVLEELGAAEFAAKLLTSLGGIYQELEDYKSAEEMYEEALRVLRLIPDLDSVDLTYTLTRQAILYYQKEDYQKARSIFESVLNTREAAWGETHPLISETCNNLATVYDAEGNYEQAIALYRRAIATTEKVLGAEHPDIIQPLNNLALSYWGTKDFEQALATASRANQVIEKNLKLILSGGSEEQKLLYISTWAGSTSSTLSLHFQAAPNDVRAARLAFATVLQRKGRLLEVSFDQFEALRRHAGKRDLATLKQLRDTYTGLATVKLRGPGAGAPAEYERHVAALEAETQRLENQVSRLASDFNLSVGEITQERVREAIPAGWALVEMLKYEPFAPQAKFKNRFAPPHYAAYVLTPDGLFKWADLGDAADIDRKVGKFRAALRDQRRADVKQLARAVDEVVMRPVRQMLGGARRVFISPDGILNLVPFGALVDERQRYLVSEYTFVYLSSGRDLLRWQRRVPSRQSALLVANPKFEPAEAEGRDSGPERQGGANAHAGDMREIFSPLPQTALEVEAIRRLLPGAKLLTDEKATEASLKEVAGPDVLHLATHGYFRAKQPSTASHVRVMRGDTLQPRIAPPDEDPLLRSGLALAGANQLRGGGNEDGVLTAREALGLDLWGTKLVVLSACETGLGDVQNGEGVYGLRRALTLAGAQSQVMSLWKVNAEATRELIVGYYKRLIAGEGRAEALRQIQLKMLLDKRNGNQNHPYFWAGFIASGDWRGISARLN